ncbi:MAG: hypothetical protein E3J90_13305 [Promethearchaeota archaeon]|nr:MAG: hypothetical protein E3J90_13305 [Candidatus Lokiarchaeota archaeon]
MEDIKIKGFRIHITIRVPHLYEKIPTFSYQFLIYNKKGKIQNYPFSRIIAQSDLEFKSQLKKKFESYLNDGEIEAYPISKFIKNITENVA